MVRKRRRPANLLEAVQILIRAEATLRFGPAQLFQEGQRRNWMAEAQDDVCEIVTGTRDLWKAGEILGAVYAPPPKTRRKGRAKKSLLEL